MRRAKGVYALWVVAFLCVGLSCIGILLVLREPRPIQVAFQDYEKVEQTDYAKLALVNTGHRRFSFGSYSTLPEGTVQHLASIYTTNGWSRAAEIRPLGQQRVLYRFTEELGPHEMKMVRVPVDAQPRRVGLLFYPSSETLSRSEALMARFRAQLLRLLHRKPTPYTVVWCPTEIKAPR